MIIQGSNNLTSAYRFLLEINNTLVGPFTEHAKIIGESIRIPSGQEYCNNLQKVWGSNKAEKVNLKDQIIGGIACSALMLSFVALVCSTL